MRQSGVLFGLVVAAAILVAAGIVTVLMLVRADELRNEAQDLDHAVLLAQTTIEAFKAGRTPDNVVQCDDLEVASEVSSGQSGLDTLTVTIRRMDGDAILTQTATIYRGGVT